MPFDKKSAKLAGKKSKRGPAKKDEPSIIGLFVMILRLSVLKRLKTKGCLIEIQILLNNI